MERLFYGRQYDIQSRYEFISSDIVPTKTMSFVTMWDPFHVRIFSFIFKITNSLYNKKVSYSTHDAKLILN